MRELDSYTIYKIRRLASSMSVEELANYYQVSEEEIEAVLTDTLIEDYGDD